MGNLLYVVVVILIIGWLVGFFGFHAGNLIHVSLVIAIVVTQSYSEEKTCLNFLR